jgi:hypothetical protein
MSYLRDVLIPGSEKVIEHYRLLLTRSTNEGERELYRAGSSENSAYWTNFRAGRRSLAA